MLAGEPKDIKCRKKSSDFSLWISKDKELQEEDFYVVHLNIYYREWMLTVL